MSTRPDTAGGWRRRDVLVLGAAAGAGALLAAAGCAGPTRTIVDDAYLRLPLAPAPGQALLGVYRGVPLRQVCEELIPRLTDLRWLRPGDVVLVKVACNSHYPHPAVTAPAALAAVVGFFKDRGVRQVVVADQAGVEHVRLTATGRVSSTRAAMARNGLLAAAERAGAVVDCFDDHGWGGYFQARPDFDGHWGAGAWLPRILDRVDHVVNLPRLSTHALAGYTCGVKNAVGWLRDDSRRLLHQQGARFYERLAEINHLRPLRDKLRFTLTLADRALLNIGPDFGGEYRFGGWLALGARRLVDHDAVASALLPWLDRHSTSFFDLYAPYPRRVDFFNRRLVRDTWGREALGAYEPLVAPLLAGRIERDPTLAHLARLEGYRPGAIAVARVGAGVPLGLLAHLRDAGGGLLRL